MLNKEEAKHDKRIKGEKGMKCPKCGSDNITTERRINGYHVCKRCSYQWQIGSNPEPTTAEQKLWWLIENFEVVSVFHCDHGKLGIRLDFNTWGKKVLFDR